MSPAPTRLVFCVRTQWWRRNGGGRRRLFRHLQESGSPAFFLNENSDLISDMQVSSWNSHDIHWYTITHDIFIDIPMIKDVSCIYPFLGNHPLRSLKLMAAQRPISTVAVLSLEFPVCSAANVLRSCDTVNLLWKPRKQESLRWPLPKQDRKNPNLVKSAMLQTCFQSIELRNKLGWLPIGLDGRWYMKIACYGRFPLKKPSDFMTFSYWHLLVPQVGKAGSLYSWT